VGTALHSASYLCSGPADVHLGLGDADAIDDLLVTWPGGTRERFTGPHVNQHIELRRGDGEPVAAP
tara:strand:+ start:241 stop:438 length:198 start_codon:yes stop_codon:yes gene_type:complete